MILLDTHAVFWLNQDAGKLSRKAQRAIERAASTGGLAIASITLWELAQLVATSKLRLKTGDTRVFLDAVTQTPSLSVLDLSAEIAALSVEFPLDLPHDPADRIIAATARVHDIPLVTRDQRMQDSPLLQTIW